MEIIALLGVEHRLIERIMLLIQKELEIMTRKSRFDVQFIDTVTDFLRTYADRCHHGKEENILFKTLGEKTLDPSHLTVMRELIAEHVQERAMVTRLVEAKEKYKHGDLEAFDDVVTQLKALVAFYPKHVAKEEQHFFKPSMDYLSDNEKQDMLRQFHDFDQSLIHTRYQEIVEQLEAE